MEDSFKGFLHLSNQESPVLLTELPRMPRHLTIPPTQRSDGFMAVHDMFHEHAIADPDRIALSCAESDQDVTYGELDSASTTRAKGTFGIGCH